MICHWQSCSVPAYLTFPWGAFTVCRHLPFPPAHTHGSVRVPSRLLLTLRLTLTPSSQRPFIFSPDFSISGAVGAPQTQHALRGRCLCTWWPCHQMILLPLGGHMLALAELAHGGTVCLLGCTERCPKVERAGALLPALQPGHLLAKWWGRGCGPCPFAFPSWIWSLRTEHWG